MKKYLTLILIFIVFGAYAQKSEFSRVPSGLRNTGPLTSQDAIMLNSIEEAKLPVDYRSRRVPDSVDNSQYEWLRPIFSQESYPNCMQSTSIAYNFTYEVNRLRGLPADTSDNQYTPQFAWNFFNGGNGWFGVNYLYTMDVLQHHGTPSVTDYGGFYNGEGERWMSGYDEWYNSMNNRISRIRKISVADTFGLLVLKHWLDNHLDGSETGGVASFIADSPWNLEHFPVGSPNTGKAVMTHWNNRPVHGMTIVGYNDSVRFDYNNDGQFTNNIDINGDGIVSMKDWEIGALKFANSHGLYFADDGFCYMMYKTLADDISEGGIWDNTVHILDAKEEHFTPLTCKVSLEHNCRKRIRVRTGISTDLQSGIPEHIQDYTILNFQGDCHYMQGNDTIPDNKTIEFGLDLSPLLSYVEPGQACKFFLLVDEDDPYNYSNGQVKYFSLMDYTNGLTVIETPCNQQNVTLLNDGRTLLSIEYNPVFDKVNITTEALPVYQAGQAIELQMEAEGGEPPYTWHLDKNYRMTMNSSVFPMIDGTQIIQSSFEDSLAVQALGFSFPFYGNTFDTVIVSSSGYLYFDENMYFWPYLVDMDYFLKSNRVIAAFLSPDLIVDNFYEHGVWYEGDENVAIFRWKNAYTPEIENSEFNFAVKLYPDGKIDYYFGEMQLDQKIRWISGLSDGDMANFSIPDLPEPSEIFPNTRIEYLVNTLPEEISITESGALSILENASGGSKDVRIVVTDNSLQHAEKVFQLIDGLEFNIDIESTSNNTIINGLPTVFKLTLRNRGAETIENITISLSTSNTQLTLPDDEEFVDILAVGESLEISHAFRCFPTEYISDGQQIVFELDVSDNTGDYSRNLVFLVAAADTKLDAYAIMNDLGILEPGETVELEISLLNYGSMMSINTAAVITPEDNGITVNTNQPLILGDILPGQSATASFNITADYSFIYGSQTAFTLDIMDELGMTRQEHFSVRVGKVPVLVVDLDPISISGPPAYDLLQEMEVQSEYTKSFPQSLTPYQCVILCLGRMFNNYELTDQQGTMLQSYLDQGGKLYMEGRVIWQQQPALPLFDMFNFDLVESPGLYEILDGVDSTFTEGLSYENGDVLPYSFFYMVPEPPAISIFSGREYPNCAAVAYDAGSYKTIGCMFELGSLLSSDTCQVKTLLENVLDYFEIVQSVIGIEEISSGNRNSSEISNYPNPFSHETSIEFKLEQSSFVDAGVYDMQGRRIYEFMPAGSLSEGMYKLSWDGKSNEGSLSPNGLYIYRILINGVPHSGKMLMIR